MKKKFNIRTFFFQTKEAIITNIKLNLLTIYLPVFTTAYISHYIYKYKLYNFSKEVFSKNEGKNNSNIERQIGKKLYPLLKFKYIEDLYPTDSIEQTIIKSIYNKLITKSNTNLKDQVNIIKSDLLILTILPTGSLFISDVITIILLLLTITYYYLLNHYHKYY